MKVKDIKKFLSLYGDEKDVKCLSASGITWEIDENLVDIKRLSNDEREVCKIPIK
ncbi:hypothetical protein LCGC14_1451000 [marine sediment metagenome]|uniref:Uncharacterized protein n=1 Tax=marine sediment metagenome TaxID=412755 RepID=A0A0F9JHS3_9ZZZZ